MRPLAVSAYEVAAPAATCTTSALLLHDMGEELEDPIGEGDASAREWRTPPLWGLGLVERQSVARFFHDGRARTIADAIAWRGGEASATVARYLALSVDDRDALLTFVRSL